jgi:cellulose synthase/poly-beta-1,6-N-acetylglucosamine synthase-like glycosyltransferase
LPSAKAAADVFGTGTSPADPTRRLACQARLMASIGIGKPHLIEAALRARRNGTTIEDELISLGVLREDIYFEAIASLLQIRYLDEINPERVILSPSIDSLLANPRRPLRLDCWDSRTLTVVAPFASDIEHLRYFLERHPQMRETFAVACPSTIRDTVWRARSSERVQESVRHLSESQPASSARQVATGWQGAVIGALCMGSIVGFFTLPGRGMLLAHSMITALFSAAIILRFLAVWRWSPADHRTVPDVMTPNLPTYTVAVAMHHEAPVVPQLIKALDALAWPRSKLDIKLVCEDDDHETIAALQACALKPEYEIVRVPRVPPFTKPKALTYALNGARGEFIVIYDAEDRPHPEQLLEAYATFERVGPDLACIQAPLVIANARVNWITSLFAIEYCGLFRGLLPFLAKANLPFPLGGTSNHLRIEALRKVGGWDPFNVTEDADLGLRLGRGRYRFAVISRPTLEDAPTEARIWISQRTRWFKGWLQTWLVVMRQPVKAFKAFGPHGFCVLQILTLGMLVAALANPLMIYFVAKSAATLLFNIQDKGGLWDSTLMAADALNLVGSYVAFLMLGYKAMTIKEKLHVGLRWLMVPVYWLMMSYAAWRSVGKLLIHPFEWEKTPHLPVQDIIVTARPVTPERRWLPWWKNRTPA